MIQQLPEHLSIRPMPVRSSPQLPNTQVAPDMLRISLLGFPQVVRSGTSILFARRAAMALLTYLAVSRRPHSRETLATLLSGEVAEDRARALLRNALNDLTSQIGEYLVVTRQSVGLNLDLPLLVDVVALEEALQLARTSGEIAQLQVAVDRYQHDFLEGFALRDAPVFDEWLLLERERIHNLLVQALDLLCAASIERGEYATGQAFARRLLAIEPWREATHQQLAIMMVRAGQSAVGAAWFNQQHPDTAFSTAVNAFVGRKRELKRLTAWLEDPTCRLLTITGVGGCGKTRLALEAVARYTHAESPDAAALFPDGVFSVALEQVAAVPDREMEAARCLLRAIADMIGITLDQQTNHADQVCDVLADMVALLVIDNIEHLRSGVAVLERLLRMAPGVKFLVTSRVQLALEAAKTLMLGPMELPESADDLERADASVLFLQQARQARAAFEPDQDQRAAIVRICRMLEGLPLGIVLAARQTRALECSAIAARLLTGTGWLAASAPDLPVRHHSLAASFAYSWALLGEAEQRALRQLSVFEGPFSTDAAVSVASAPAARLHSLYEAGMLTTTGDGRYCVSGLLRPQIAHLCEQAGEEQEARLRHATYYTKIISQSLPSLAHHRTKQNMIERELPNIQAAWAWMLLQIAD